MTMAADPILSPPQQVEYPLPEGVFRDARGSLFFNRPVFRGFYDDNDTLLKTAEEVEAARRRGSDIFEDHDQEPVPCVVPPPWADEQQLEMLRREARLAEKWFWHPGMGWLPWGRKRSGEAPENRGTGSIQRVRVRRAVPALTNDPIVPHVEAPATLNQAVPPIVGQAAEAVIPGQSRPEPDAAPRRGRPPLSREEN